MTSTEQSRRSRQPGRGVRWAGALGTVAAVLAGLGLAQLAAALSDPRSSPVALVGGVVIDLTPAPVKDAVIALAGTGDKAVLILCVLLGTLALSALAGLGLHRTAVPALLWSATVALIAVLTAITRLDGSPAHLVPGAVLAVVACAVVLLVHRLLVRAQSTVRLPTVIGGASASGEASAGGASVMGGADRRRLLAAIAGSAGVGIIGAAIGTAVRPAAPTREISLPTPRTTLPDLPAGLDVDGISPLRTSAKDLYRIDTALVVPGYRYEEWDLSIDGMVEAPFRLTLDELLAEEMVEIDATMLCVSNPVGGDLAGSVRFQGVRVADLLQRARPRSGADQVLSTSVDGFAAGTPLDILQERDRNALIVVGIDGQPLSGVHGAPARLFTPGLYGYVGATKWLRRLSVGTFAEQKAYWTTRGWSERGPVKTSARIDTPGDGSRPRPGGDGKIPIAGVAWAVHRGVGVVQVSIDGGDWIETELSREVNRDYWRQWLVRATLEPGPHSARARAADASGTFQDPEPAAPAPNGSQGYHQVEFTVRG